MESPAPVRAFFGNLIRRLADDFYFPNERQQEHSVRGEILWVPIAGERRRLPAASSMCCSRIRSVSFILNRSRGQDLLAKVTAQVARRSNVNLAAQQFGQLHLHARQTKRSPGRDPVRTPQARPHRCPGGSDPSEWNRTGTACGCGFARKSSQLPGAESRDREASGPLGSLWHRETAVSRLVTIASTRDRSGGTASLDAYSDPDEVMIGFRYDDFSRETQNTDALHASATTHRKPCSHE